MANKIIIGMNIGLKKTMLSNINVIDKRSLTVVKIIGKKMNILKNLGQ